MANSNLAKKFLSKIEAMTFEEIDERASRARDCGIPFRLDDADDVEEFINEINHISDDGYSTYKEGCNV